MSNIAENKNFIDPFGRIGGKKKTNTIDEGRKKVLFQNIRKEVPLFVKVHQAWLLMMVRQNIIQREQAVITMKALMDINEESIEQMIANWNPSAWESMVLFEQYLTSLIGQHATDLNIARTIPPPFYRMELLPLLSNFIEELIQLLSSLLNQAELHTETVMPGYTHLQHAQPMTYGHYLVGLFDPLQRALRQLEAAYSITNQFELGCGALSGTSFNIDRDYPASLLGFDGVLEHSNDSVAATDFMVDILAGLTNVFIPLSRVANDFDIWSSFEFNMIEVDDEICNPSSMMPQKKNPAVFEFCRRTIATILGSFTEVVCGSHATQYGDVTEMRELAFSVQSKIEESTKQVLLFRQALDTMIVKKERMLELAQDGFSTATELAAVLYREAAIPLRMAHGIVAETVKHLLEKHRTMTDLTPEVVITIAKRVTGQEIDISYDVLKASIDPVNFVKVHTSQGGVSPQIVSNMIKERKIQVEAFRERQTQRLQKKVQAFENLQSQAKKMVGS